MAGLDLDADALQDAFDDHPSLSASLEDFEHHGAFSEPNRSPTLNIASHHSGFYNKSEETDSESHSDSGGPFSPPAERKVGRRKGNYGWSAHRLYQQEPVSGSEHDNASPLRRSREGSPQYESAEEGDTTLPAHVRLPTESPRKRSLSPSPQPYPEGSRDFGPSFGNQRNESGSVTKAENPNNCKFCMFH